MNPGAPIRAMLVMMHIGYRLLLALLCLFCVSIPAMSQDAQISIFGEGLFVQPKTGGLGVRAGFPVVPNVDLEGEVVREFNSQAFKNASGQKFYNTGYSFLGGPRLRLPVPLIHLFATAKGGFLRSTTHAEDPSQAALPRVTSGAAYVGGGAEIGGTIGVRFDAGDLILVKSGLRRNNARFTAGIFFRF